MPQGLTDYLNDLRAKRPDEFVVVKDEVDPAFGITMTVVKTEAEKKRRPVFLFEKVKGSAFPVLTNLHASRARLASAMGSPPKEMLKNYFAAMEKPVPPREVNTGPCKDVVLKDGQVNMLALPQIVHHQGDGGAYITAAISFAKHPDDGTWNCAYNRLMLPGKDPTSVHLTLGKHLWEYYKIAEARGKPLEVAFAIGVHPAIALGALAI